MKKISILTFLVIALGAICFFLHQKYNSEPTSEIDFGDEKMKFRFTENKELSPYAIFGDSSVVLLTEAERSGKQFLEIMNSDKFAEVQRMEFEQKTGKIRLFDKDDNLIEEGILAPETIARFLSVDPLASDFASWSPYNYAVNNPVSYIDPDGRSAVPVVDKENKTVTINATLNFYGSGATSDRAAEIAASIQGDWNAANGTIDIGGEAYSVQFNVTGKKISKFKAALGKVFGGAENNYINLSEGGPKSKVDKMAGNTGSWSWREGGITNKEYSHEFGHLLGWYDKSQFKVAEYGSHDYVGYSSPNIPGGGNAPGIMTPSNAPQTSRNAGSNFSSLYYRNDGSMINWTRAVTQGDINRIGINPNAPNTPITHRSLRNHPRYTAPSGKPLIQYIKEQSK